ncbi:MAG: LytR/AlgR family response regulator transcription factor [Lachnospiraceae bacterium]
MIHILVLEDQQMSREALVNILKHISHDISVSEAAAYEEAEAFLNSDITYDLFMLDINLDMKQPEDISGMAFAEEIRKRRGYEFTPVVMITSVASLEMSAYRDLHCYQYIVKPFFSQDVEDVVNKLLQQHKQPEQVFITVKKEGINYRINCDDIVYIKAIPRGVCLYLRYDHIEVPYLTIRKLQEQLPQDEFLQCHRMFVIHIKYVNYLDLVNQMISMQGSREMIDIGVTYKTEVRRILGG